MIQIHDPSKNPDPSFTGKVNNILRSGDITTGKYTEQVENYLKEMHNCEHVLFTGSGTGAFYMLCKVAQERYDPCRIKMPEFTWKSTKKLAKDLFDDVEWMDCNIDTFLWWNNDRRQCNNALDVRNCTFGNRGKLDDLENLDRTIIDGAYSIGDSGLPGNSFGAFLSFSPAKPVTSGEGGAILTNRDWVYKKCKELRRYFSRPSELNAAYALLELDEYDRDKEKDQRLRLRKRYDEQTPDYFKPQEISENHTLGEMAFVAEDWEEQVHLARRKLSEVCEVRMRYEPCESEKLARGSNSEWVYKHIIMLPMTDNVDDVALISSKISRGLKG